MGPGHTSGPLPVLGQRLAPTARGRPVDCRSDIPSLRTPAGRIEIAPRPSAPNARYQTVQTAEVGIANSGRRDYRDCLKLLPETLCQQQVLWYGGYSFRSRPALYANPKPASPFRRRGSCRVQCVQCSRAWLARPSQSHMRYTVYEYVPKCEPCVLGGISRAISSVGDSIIRVKRG